MTENLQDMSDEEFMDAWTEASEALSEAREACKEFAAENRRRDAMKVLDEMPDEQKKLLAQYVGADSIDSEESVNGE